MYLHANLQPIKNIVENACFGWLNCNIDISLYVQVYFSKKKVVGFSKMDIYITVQKSKTEKSLVFTFFFQQNFHFSKSAPIMLWWKTTQKREKNKNSNTQKSAK